MKTCWVLSQNISNMDLVEVLQLDCQNFSGERLSEGSSNSGGLLYIFTSIHLHIYTYHLQIFTSTHHLHICTSSHLHVYTYHLHIFTSTHIILTSSHLLSLPPSLPPSLSLSLLPSVTASLPFFFSSLLSPRAVPTRRHEMATLSHEMRCDRQKRK